MSEASCSRSELQRREGILNALHAGRTPVEIIELFRYPKATVYRIASQCKAAQEAQDYSGQGPRKTHDRERHKRCAELISHVQEAIYEDPTLSVRTLALTKSTITMHRIIHEDLRYSSYSKSGRCYLSLKNWQELLDARSC